MRERLLQHWRHNRHVLTRRSVRSVKPLMSVPAETPVAGMTLTQGLNPAINLIPGKSHAQSVTQVAAWVVPKMVLPKPGGLKPKKKRIGPTNIRLDEAEKEIVKRKAHRVGLSVHAYLKCLALGLDYDPLLRKTLLQIYGEMTAQGRNFNQITKHVNSGRIVTSPGLETALYSIQEPMVDALKAVSRALTHGLSPQP